MIYENFKKEMIKYISANKLDFQNDLTKIEEYAYSIIQKEENDKLDIKAILHEKQEYIVRLLNDIRKI